MIRYTFCFLILIFSCQEPEREGSILISHVVIVDGTGQPAYEGAVRIEDGRIVETGNLKPGSKEKIIDGKGHYLSPGFIDTHSHHDSGRAPTFEAAISQGITSIVIGQDGFSRYPLGPYLDTLDTNPAPINIASYIGHNTIRLQVMGVDDYAREATRAEIDSMKVLLINEMKSGALGMSTGLEYDPGIYSSENEVVELAKVLQPINGRYISHMRSEDVKLEESIEEIINIGKEAEIPVQISHFKLGRKGLWGKAKDILQRLDRAREEGVDITADIYPYEYWSSTMTVLFPKRDFENIESARFAITELTTPEGMIISTFKADTTYEGKTLDVIAKERDQDPAQTYLDLIKMSREVPGESIIAKSMTYNDIYTLLAWPYANLCSDGSPKGHPRGWGSFPRYFDQANELSIEARIQKMTSASAKNIGLESVGVIKPGAHADLVLFDKEKLKDHATFEKSSMPSEGINRVWISGEQVFINGKLTGNRPGRVIRRNQDIK